MRTTITNLANDSCVSKFCENLLKLIRSEPPKDLEAFVFPELQRLLARLFELKEKQLKTQQEQAELRSLSREIKSRKITRENTISSVCKNLFLFAKSFSHPIHFNNLDGRFYIFSGTHHVPVENEKINFLFIAAAENLGINGSDAAYHKFLSDCSRTYACSFPLPRPEPSPSTLLINTLNCTLAIDVSTGAVTPRQHNWRDGLTYVLPYAYDALATCPKFDAFLYELFEEEAIVNHFAQHLGYLLIPHSSGILPLEKIPVLYGAGANGKSTLRKIVTAVLGKENVAGLSFSDLQDANARALLLGKIVNFPEEMGELKDFDLFKRLASGESISYKILFKDKKETNCYPKFILCTNHLPVGDKTDAFERRLDIFFLKKKFSGSARKVGLAEEIIKEELPGILNLFIAALRSILRSGGFKEAEAVAAEAKELRNLTDSVAAFLDRFEIEPGFSEVLLADLRKTYEKFCLDELGAKPVAAFTFSQRLKAAGFKIEVGRGRQRKVKIKSNSEFEI